MNNLINSENTDNSHADNDVFSLPEEFTGDYDVVTLADLGMAGTDYETSVSSGTYTYNGKSETKSVIVKLGWQAEINHECRWKLALDTYWNANCMVWFRDDALYFCPGQEMFDGLRVKADAVTKGRHDIEFGRLYVIAGPNTGKDYVFLKIDGEMIAEKYTDYYRSEGGYIAYSLNKTTLSYTVCFVDEGVSQQGFGGFAEPDGFVDDIDYVNIGDVVPGGLVKDSVHDKALGYTYPFTSLSKTHSTIVRFVIKTGPAEGREHDKSFMVVDIGGNCGYCRSYIPAGVKERIMFGWEIEGCTVGTKKYKIENNSWYAVEQGRLRVVTGINSGKDYIYIKINGKVISYFYGNPASRPFPGGKLYIEATSNIQILGYNELHARYYIGEKLYLDDPAQKGLGIKKPKDPKTEGRYFEAWHTEKSGGELFDFRNTTLTEDINLYAQFSDNTVNAVFDPANGQPCFTITSGMNCLVERPEPPSLSDPKYDFVFKGWKKDPDDRIFDFENDRLTGDAHFTAQYSEREYFVSYYSMGRLTAKVPFILSNPTVTGKEPDVPKIANAEGTWEEHRTEGLTRNITVNALYKVNVPSPCDEISLEKYNGGTICLNTDKIKEFLSKSSPEQTAYVKDFCSSDRVFQDHQNTAFRWSDSTSNSSYTIYFADNREFSSPFIVTSDSTSLINKAGIFIPGKTYYWFVCGNDNGKCSGIDSFTVADTPVRYITAGKVTNVRDIGGYITDDGRKVKYGMVYRGASLDEFHSYADTDALNAFGYIGLKSEIELRGEAPHSYTGWDANNPNVYFISGSGYESMLSLNSDHKDQYRSAFEAMAEKENYPFYFHCSAGADRTGSFAYLISGLLGVRYKDIRGDYELTSFSEVGLRTADVFNSVSFDRMNRLMLEMHGNGADLKTAIRNYLIGYIGVKSSSVDAIIEIMFEDK